MFRIRKGGKDISLPLFLIIAIFTDKNDAQPTRWADVCVQDATLPITHCYLWTGAPFPFNDISSFLKNNLFCPLIKGQKCNIYISPVLLNCLVNTALNDTTAPPIGCQFYKPSNSSSNVILCNLNTACSGPDPLSFLISVYSNFNASMNNDWINQNSLYAVSDIFGGPGQTTGPNYAYLSGLFGGWEKIDLNNPPPARIRWDGPITILTPDITIDSMWMVAGLKPLRVNVQISSNLNSPTPIAVPTCTVFNVMAPGVSFRNIDFCIDPQCSSLFTANTRGSIVYNNGIGNVFLTNLSSSITSYPLVYMLDNYDPSPVVNISSILFDNTLNGSLVPVVPSETLPTQNITFFATVLLQFGGLVTVDQISPGLVLGSQPLICLGGCQSANFVDTLTFYTGINMSLVGCQNTIWSNSVCDQKNATDLVLVITTSIILATLLVYAFFEICRHRRNTLAHQRPA